MDTSSMYEKLLSLFRREVTDIGDDSHYYAKVFNEGIRLCYEDKQTYSPLVTAELMVAFEKYKQWKYRGQNDTSLLDLNLQLIERYKTKLQTSQL